MTMTPTKHDILRARFREDYKSGISPVDSRKPIPDDLAIRMVSQLIDMGIDKTAEIAVIDAYMIMTTHLVENGFTNITILENNHTQLNDSQELYYNNIKYICQKQGFTYYVPPMNNYNRCNMKFDVIIGNPPYQSPDGGGSVSGSTTNPLWMQITDIAIDCLNPDGIISFITPTNFMNGGDVFTSKVLGKDRKYDLLSVDFNVNGYFSVGIPICKWVVRKSLTSGNIVQVNGNQYDTDTIYKIYENSVFNDIMHTLMNYGNNFEFNQSGSYDVRAVANYLRKNNLPVEWNQLSDIKTDDYIYPVNNNGKIKYSRVEWKNVGVWRVFYPQLQNPSNIMIGCEEAATGATFTMKCDTQSEAQRVYDNINDPCYQWVINQTRVSGRVTNILSLLPNSPISEVLSPEQLSYIQSQL